MQGDVRVNSLLQGWVVLQMTTNGFAHHGVLAHQHYSLVSQRHTDGLHLLGAHIVCSHDEAFWIVIQKLLRSKTTLLRHFQATPLTSTEENGQTFGKLSVTYDDFHKIVGLPRGPVFPGHLCSASKDRLTAGLKTRWFLDPNTYKSTN